jgi:hypothetical protein
MPNEHWKHPVENAKIVRGRDLVKVFVCLAGLVGLMAVLGGKPNERSLETLSDQATAPALSFSSAHVISVPSDKTGSYTAELVTEMKQGLAHVVSKRVGPSGTSYTKRECRCGDATSRTLGSGETIDQMQASPMDPRHTPLMMDRDGMGSSAFHVCEHACAAIGYRLDRSKTR